MRRAVAVVLLLTACMSPVKASPSPIVVIFMENKPYKKLEAFPAASHAYLDAFGAAGVRFTNYTEGDATGGSLPDYLGVVAGSSCGKTNDTTKAADPTVGSACPTNLWNQLDVAGISWGVYEEGMPTACSALTQYKSVPTDGPYVLKHNPAVPFPSIYGHPTCAQHVLPYSSFDVHALPALSFIAPNMCDDQHGTSNTQWTNCTGNSTALVQRGDDWLRARVPAMLAAGARVFITYDESGTMYAAYSGGSGLDNTPFTHYSLLRGLEDHFALSCLRGACTATPLPL